MNILTGIYRPDAGEIIIDGNAVTFASPIDAIAAGIGMVHQHFKLVRAFTVAENIHLGWNETPGARRPPASSKRARGRLPQKFNLAVDPRRPRRRAFRRRAAAGGDPARARARRAHPHPRRADRGADAGGGGGALSTRCATFAPAATRSSSSATSSTRCWRSPTASPCCAAAGRSRPRTRADCNHRMLARLMVGRDIVFGDYQPARRGAAPRVEGADPVAARRVGLDERGVAA